MKKNLTQFLPVLIGLGLVLLGGVLGWVSYTDWSTLRLSAEELFQRKQGSVLALPGGMEKLNREISLLQKSHADLAKELQDLTQPGYEAWAVGQPWASDPGQWKDRLIEVTTRCERQAARRGRATRLFFPKIFTLDSRIIAKKAPRPPRCQLLPGNLRSPSA